MTNQKKASARYSREVRERAVRMVFDHAGEYTSQWAAIGSSAAKIGYAAQTLHTRVSRAERNRGIHARLTHSPSERSKSDALLGSHVRASLLASDPTFGARRVWRDVLAEGFDCGLLRI